MKFNIGDKVISVKNRPSDNRLIKEGDIGVVVDIFKNPYTPSYTQYGVDWSLCHKANGIYFHCCKSILLQNTGWYVYEDEIKFSHRGEMNVIDDPEFKELFV